MSFYKQGMTRMAESKNWMEPDGYESHRVRDWRWAWLRWRTVMVPVWDDVVVTLVAASYTPELPEDER